MVVVLEMILKKACVSTGDGDTTGQDNGDVNHSQQDIERIRLCSIQTVPSQSTEGYGGSGVRRMLFPPSTEKGKGIVVDDGPNYPLQNSMPGLRGGFGECGEGTSDGERAVPDNSIEQWPGTDMTGIINLADAATPSLSYNIEDNEDERAHCSSEDERVLREFELLEQRQEELAREKGKGPVLQSPEQIVPQTPYQVYTEVGDFVVPDRGDLNDVGSEECSTDGVTPSPSEVPVDYEYDMWNDADNGGFVGELDMPPMELGGPSSVAEPQNAECDNIPVGGTNSVEACLLPVKPNKRTPDVGDQVLSYVTTARRPPNPRNSLDDDINNEASLPTEDPELVFDDVIYLTNTDGCGPVSAEEDAIFIGRLFKDKDHMQNTISIYAIKRLFYFRQTRSDPERLIFNCVDPHCRWRVFGHVVSSFQRILRYVLKP
ncbi:PREDICTED: uncharacterized protein LOC104706919 [Camelina sativa]|uniref:Uncharacterized protein LOC104706919 n=1 Tax=Camelina sativa TaxID=90675 RepID=A0ABM0T668_CAMSA|nr:PREDICTED: uncharacterized protein LOC104706919 [Camelina sativa]XP_010421460.1 PREDICTED: uncharacterized protein LOC104706919 [Camelina sativa]XP_019084652.1 PREDICTED: uncharacterized protein LOC104706919 [Camelina sativa]